MATQKSTTRGKTKTTTRKKTKPAGAAARATKARTTKVSTKVTAVKAVANTTKDVRDNRTNWSLINRLLAGATVLYAAAAVAVLLLMDKLAPALTLTHLTSDPLQSQSGTVFVTAYRELFNVDVRWLLLAMLLMSMVAPVLYLTKLKAFYTEHISNRRAIFTRWLDFAVSGALMVAIVNMLCGLTDLAQLKLSGSLILVAGALSWLAERQNEQSRRPEWSAYTIGLFAAAMPWVMIGVTKVSTVLHGEVRSPWYVYALCIVTLLGFVAVAVNQCLQIRRLRSWANNLTVERNYLLIATATKVAFAAILIAGLAKNM